MARKAQKKTKKVPARSQAKAKAKPAKKPVPVKAKANAKAKARGGAATSVRKKKSEAESEVEKHWQQYWDCRKRLEEAVSLVRAAREALAQAQEQERGRRIEFDKVKGSLTNLLDVDPVAGQSVRPRSVQQLQSDALELAQSSDESRRLP